MAPALERLQQDLNAARKAQDKHRLMLLGMVLSEVGNRRIELRRDPTAEEVVEVVRRAIKRRRESVEMYEKAGRQELADRESAEIGMLEEYLPPAVPEEEIRSAIRDAISAGATNIGAVMGKVVPQFKGRTDGSVVSALAREELSRTQ
jgi:uncharacterized protein